VKGIGRLVVTDRAFWTRLCKGFCLGSGFALLGCGLPGEYAGIRYTSHVERRYVVNLAWDASRGNPRAEFELAALYEEGGRGLPRNLLCAARLYEAAATGAHTVPEAAGRLERLRSVLDTTEQAARPRCDDVAERTKWRAAAGEPIAR
jgi:TPR repeat protein